MRDLSAWLIGQEGVQLRLILISTKRGEPTQTTSKITSVLPLHHTVVGGQGSSCPGT